MKSNKIPYKEKQQPTYSKANQLTAKEGDEVLVTVTLDNRDVHYIGKVFHIDTRRQGYYIMFKHHLDFRIDTYNIHTLQKPTNDNPNNKSFKEAYDKAKQFLHYGEEKIRYRFFFHLCPNVKVKKYIPSKYIVRINQEEEDPSNTYSLEELLEIITNGPRKFLPDF